MLLVISSASAANCHHGMKRLHGYGAQMSVTLMVATLMQRFRFRPLPRAGAPAFPLQVAYDITLNFNPTNGLQMEVVPR